MRRTIRRKSKKCTSRNYGTHVRRTTRRNSQKHAVSGILGLLCVEQDAGNLKKWTFGILGLLCAEQDVGNLNKCTFRNSGTPVRRPRRQKSHKHAVSGILGLLCAAQDVGNLKKWTFKNSGAPVRRRRRRKSQKMDFQEFWDSCALNKTSEISKHALSGILGLLCAEQGVGNLKTCTFRNSSNQNKLRWLGQNLFVWDTPPGDHALSQNHPKSTPEVSSGQPWAPFCSSRPDAETHFAT